jgi:hypothetical protein
LSLLAAEPVPWLGGSTAGRSAVDYEKARELLLHHLRYSGGVDLDKAHEIHHEDAVLEFPQSGERFVGKANILGFRKRFPVQVDYEPLRLRGCGDLWVMELRGVYGGDSTNPGYGAWIVEFRGDKVQHETIYFGEPFPAPDWRRPWAEEGATWERQGDLPARLPHRS